MQPFGSADARILHPRGRDLLAALSLFVLQALALFSLSPSAHVHACTWTLTTLYRLCPQRHREASWVILMFYSVLPATVRSESRLWCEQQTRAFHKGSISGNHRGLIDSSRCLPLDRYPCSLCADTTVGGCPRPDSVNGNRGAD